MYNPQKDVETFMQTFGQEVKDSPEMPSREVLLLRAKLLFEEVMEFVEAAGCDVTLNNGKLEIVVSYFLEPNMLGMLDAIADISYVNYGAAAALGVDAQAAFNEVHRSNMSKIWPDGTVHKNEFGKILKPESYSPADLKKFVTPQERN